MQANMYTDLCLAVFQLQVDLCTKDKRDTNQ